MYVQFYKVAHLIDIHRPTCRVPVKFWTSIMFMCHPAASLVIILGESHTVTMATMLDTQILLLHQHKTTREHIQ